MKTHRRSIRNSLAILPPLPPRRPSEAEDPPSSRRANQQLVLLVGTDPETRRVLHDAIRDADFDVLAVGTAESGSNAAMISPHVVAVSMLSDPERLGNLVATWRNDSARARIPLLAITRDGDVEGAEAILAAGADEVLPWPASRLTVRARLRSVACALTLQAEASRFETALEALVRTFQARERYTFDHSERVAEFASEAGEAAGLSKGDVDRIRQAAHVHDIGMVAIPDRIVLEPGPLSPAEMARVRSHPVVGYELLRDVPSQEALRPFVHRHHERIDGSGYPDGLVGREIPVPVQVLSLSDSYTAMTSARPYREALSHGTALQTLWEEARRGVWDTELVKVFEKAVTSLGVEATAACAAG